MKETSTKIQNAQSVPHNEGCLHIRRVWAAVKPNLLTLTSVITAGYQKQQARKNKVKLPFRDYLSTGSYVTSLSSAASAPAVHKQQEPKHHLRIHVHSKWLPAACCHSNCSYCYTTLIAGALQPRITKQRLGTRMMMSLNICCFTFFWSSLNPPQHACRKEEGGG